MLNIIFSPAKFWTKRDFHYFSKKKTFLCFHGISSHDGVWTKMFVPWFHASHISDPSFTERRLERGERSERGVIDQWGLLVHQSKAWPAELRQALLLLSTPDWGGRGDLVPSARGSGWLAEVQQWCPPVVWISIIFQSLTCRVIGGVGRLQVSTWLAGSMISDQIRFSIVMLVMVWSLSASLSWDFVTNRNLDVELFVK